MRYITLYYILTPKSSSDRKCPQDGGLLRAAMGASIRPRHRKKSSHAYFYFFIEKWTSWLSEYGGEREEARREEQVSLVPSLLHAVIYYRN